MEKYAKATSVIVILAVVLFVVCGISFNLIFRHISYSFYKNAEPSTTRDTSISRLEIGVNKDLIGYIRKGEANRTILYFGGSGEIAYNAVLKYGEIFKDYTLVSVDYPGSQESKGFMNLETMQEAAVRLYDYVLDLDSAAKDNIYVVGYSYGTGIAAYLASQRDCVGLVLVAPYRNVIDLYNAIIPVFHSPFGWFITDNINTKEYAKTVSARTLIITSNSDTTIKSSISYSLADDFSHASVSEFSGLKHEEYWSNPEVISTILSFCE
ncbi:alpha/beta fold hydrolase [Paenibacillus motobuensis]|uniref:AB hydrolase-1 domain-containing protein n=1 Tax=Paenibacillus motobuensis TaxID=295324 RepID=A0ABP3HXV4_9BACL